MAQDRTGLSQNVGTEWELDLVVNGQVVAEFGLLETRDRKVNGQLVRTVPSNSNGRPVSRWIPEDYTHTFAYVRQDDTFDDVVGAIMNAYRAQGANVQWSGTETVVNNGTASQYLWTGGTFVPGSMGNIKGADKTDGVTFEIHWTDFQKTRGASNAPNLTVGTGL
jgi:hypothetical protein